ncbi:MAG: hypothetical protein HN849_20655 [Victivallales bacterium]|jgi:hypothetical protein|nr:hypothetical protein [Victivallales bacterium]
MDGLRLLANSKIRVVRENGDQRFYWTRPTGGFLRYATAVMFGSALCTWWGILTFMWFLGAGEARPPASIGVFALLYVLGSVVPVVLLYLLLRPQIPESVTLGRHRFSHDSGSAPLNPMDVPSPASFLRRGSDRRNPLVEAFGRSRRIELAKPDCPEFILERTPEGQRLRFDVGAKRVAIGACLTEPEREWLAEVLSSWRSG